MTDTEMASRLTPITEICTLSEGVRNRIVRIGTEGVTVMSERTENERTIPYQDIRTRSSSHGCIIDSFRQILGL